MADPPRLGSVGQCRYGTAVPHPLTELKYRFVRERKIRSLVQVRVPNRTDQPNIDNKIQVQDPIRRATTNRTDQPNIDNKIQVQDPIRRATTKLQNRTTIVQYPAIKIAHRYLERKLTVYDGLRTLTNGDNPSIIVSIRFVNLEFQEWRNYVFKERKKDIVLTLILKAQSAVFEPAEQEFQEHLNSLRITVEDGSQRCMVERRGRDVSGKWIYLCYPCAAVCSGESILQTHISGKKHKIKIAMRNTWSQSIFDDHPYIQSERGGNKTVGATEKVLQKMAQEVDLHNKNPSELDVKYNKYKNIQCHLQDIVDGVKAPLLGLEYLVEHPPEQAHYEPSYMCTLCSKQGHPRTIINHMTCFWHRYNYLVRHFAKACSLMTPYRAQPKYRDGVGVIMNRLAQRIEDKYGRQRPVHIDKEEYEKHKEGIHQWIFKGYHFSENGGPTFEEVVDVDLINTLLKDNESKHESRNRERDRDPSPPNVAAPSKPHFNSFTRSATRQERRGVSMESLSDISDEQEPRRRPAAPPAHHDRDRDARAKYEAGRARYSPYPERRRASPRARGSRAALPTGPGRWKRSQRAPNYEYKLKLAEDKRLSAEESAKKTLAYHEKNPEKHPLYPEEWKKFWNRRYKEIQTEGKDPSKHDFKPEWIVFWTARMKELHDAELKVVVNEIYRKLCISPPDMRKRSPELQHRITERRRSGEGRRRSPAVRRSPPPPRRRSPPPLRRRSPESPAARRKSPTLRRRSPDPRHERRTRSPARTNFTLESVRRSRSPLSRREAALRNRSPAPAPAPAPSLQTVLISDDELKLDDGLSPWNSDNEIDSLGSSPARGRGRAGSSASRSVRSRREGRERAPLGSGGGGGGGAPHDLGPPENVVVTLRLLVALEDYLGSLGPKVVDLLTDALKMEKEKANSSEELLVRESAVVLVETAKEKLKGAVQAGLVPAGAAAAVRAAIVRAAATLHVADTRARAAKADHALQAEKAQGAKSAGAAGVAVAGVGEVDRAQIAQQMAAALVAQGKTDVSSEELAQLVDAVVGMAETSKRNAALKKEMSKRNAELNKGDHKVASETSKSLSGTASALQMLQTEKPEAPDAMDGLSDSDLETLLKNFNELSAEEQHSLIAYLKKLEAREPQRVERLRQYVSAAAASAASAPAPAAAPAPAPAAAPTSAPAPAPAASVSPAPERAKPIPVDSDDDDYTVEEVLQSVTQKVKENQIRQEMEIVKKSLEETKTPAVEPEVVKGPPAEVSKGTCSAANLLALMHASIQSTTAAPADVVATSPQLRSFGDLPIPPLGPPSEAIKPIMQTQVTQSNQPINIELPSPAQQPAPYNNQHHQQPLHQRPQQQPPQQQQQQYHQQQHQPPQHIPFNSQQGLSLRGPPPIQSNFGSHQNVWDQRPMNNTQDVRGPLLRPSGYNNNFGQDNHYNQQGSRPNYMNGRMQENYDTRHNENMNQQFGNYEQNNYGRRGRGNFGGHGGPMRGRGRGYY
ncbi:hypothetical protein MSG28_000551 [Choristoneura fumiferana]|uniref:Uncharacterized protein n=1 Tax=Choristoneura fumiferana TaxID=7141 RepID=A0ACC0K149_CHOFU|nr:hypothetical protein MSG28_000551 [Choristoneura fumiferana]